MINYQLKKCKQTKKSLLFLFSSIFIIIGINTYGQQKITLNSGHYSFKVPENYLQECDNIPNFWITSINDVTNYLYENVKNGKIEIIGKSAGGRLIRSINYGNSRQGKGTSTFSGSLGFGNVKAYRGPDHEKKVYLAIAAVHGGEFEGIVGMVNLISVIETGKDLRNKEWPEINEMVNQLDRIILIPILNPDGRARIPLRMEQYRNTDYTVHEFLNCGGNEDGTIIGWPQIKEFIPLDFGKPIFPGGYPNDAGVNLQHDDFFGNRQPETQILFDLCDKERPDLIINMHTGAKYMNLHRPFSEPILSSVFDSLYVYIHKRLATEGLQYRTDTIIKVNQKLVPMGTFNLDGALNLHCGALSVIVESPSHGFSGINKDGTIAFHTPDMLLDAQLICHQEAMKFLVQSGGRSEWIEIISD